MKGFRTLALAALAASAAAWGSTVMALDLPALAKASDTIVRGTVRSIESRLSKDGSRVVTDVTLDVQDTLKGQARQSLVVLQPGGVVGEVGQKVEGLPGFQLGEEVVVFLERRGSERFIVAGMAQGKYRVERSSDGKAVFAAPDPEAGHLLLIDAMTGKPTARARESMTLGALEALVREALVTPVVPGTSTGTRTSPKLDAKP